MRTLGTETVLAVCVTDTQQSLNDYPSVRTRKNVYGHC